jgi:hypothetical protein
MKLPVSFGNRLLFRLVFPGAAFAAALWPAVLAFCMHSDMFVFSHAVYWPVAVIFLGFIVSSLDQFIYMTFEGRNWFSMPRRLATKFQNWRLSRWKENKNIFGFTIDSSESDILIYRYPLDSGKYYPNNGKPAAVLPTELGNVIYGYETYPIVKYGVDGVFFWHRLEWLMDKDARSEFHERQAVCDSILYLSFTFFLSAFIFTAYLVFNFLSIWYIPYSTIVSIPIFLSLGFIFYRFAISENYGFGESYKAAVDIYLKDLDWSIAEKEIEKSANQVEFEDISDSGKYLHVWRYLRWHMKKPILTNVSETIVRDADWLQNHREKGRLTEHQLDPDQQTPIAPERARPDE